LPEIFFKFKKKTIRRFVIYFLFNDSTSFTNFFLTLCSLESYITNHKTNIKSNETIAGLVFPVYIWDLPKMVVNFLEKLTEFIREIYV